MRRFVRILAAGTLSTLCSRPRLSVCVCVCYGSTAQTPGPISMKFGIRHLYRRGSWHDPSRLPYRHPLPSNGLKTAISDAFRLFHTTSFTINARALRFFMRNLEIII